MIKLMKSTFYREEETKKGLCDFIMQAEQLSMGEKCFEFEKKFSEYQGRSYGVFFNSGSSANLALISALINLGRLRGGDRIGFSALTWATNVMPLLQLNLNPVPIDILLENLNVNSWNLDEKLERENLQALFITNLLGFCGDLDKIYDRCKEKRIILLEDNCESLGSQLAGRKLGNFGLASSFSFFVGHHLSTIEGGAVCTDDKEVYEMLKMIRSHGWDRNLSLEEQIRIRRENDVDNFHAKYTFYVLGYNLRPTEIQAMIGLEQLKYIDEINKIRSRNFWEFQKISRQNEDFEELDVSHMDFVSNFVYPIVCKDAERFEKYINRFQEGDIEIRPIVGGSIVEQPFFREYTDKNDLVFDCPNARHVHEHGFYFPNNPELTEEERKLICGLLK